MTTYPNWKTNRNACFHVFEYSIGVKQCAFVCTQIIMSGDERIDVDLLKRRTEYEGCNSDSEVIRWLWTILGQFDEVL